MGWMSCGNAMDWITGVVLIPPMIITVCGFALAVARQMWREAGETKDDKTNARI